MPAAHALQIETSKLVLREYLAADWRAIHVYGSDPEVCRFQPWGPNSEEETREFLRLVIGAQNEVPRKTFELAIVEKSSARVIGGIGLRLQSFLNRDADFGYTLRRDAWNKGYATEAARAMVRFGFERLGLHRIWATVSPDNLASVRVLEKVGLRREGLMRENLNVRGKWRDSFLYAVLEREFSAAGSDRA